MNNPNIGYVAVLAPVFAFCLALLTVLGRIYFLKLFETLGIPASDVHLSAIDYSVISPDVTTMGIGICILLPVLVWGMLLFEPSPKYRQMWIGGGLSLFVVGAILGAFSLMGTLPEFVHGVPGIWSVGAIAIPLTGFLVMVSGISSKSTDTKPSDAANTDDPTSTAKRVQKGGFVLTLGFIVALIWIFSVGSYESSKIAKQDAERLLEEPPQATITFTSPDGHDFLHSDSEDREGESAKTNVGLILISDKFVYLRLIDKEEQTEEQRRAPPLYAIPIRDISRITYAPSGTHR